MTKQKIQDGTPSPKDKKLVIDTPLNDPTRDKTWEKYAKRKGVTAYMRKVKKDFKFPLDGSYDVWCVAWENAWYRGYYAGLEQGKELRDKLAARVKT